MMSNNHKLKVFSGRANRALAERIANNLGDTLGRIVLDNFPDGEISVRIDEDVRGRDVFLIQPTVSAGLARKVDEHQLPLVIGGLQSALQISGPFRFASAARACASGNPTQTDQLSLIGQ